MSLELGGEGSTIKTITITVPGVPVPKARARVSIRKGKVRAYTPSKTRDYEDHIRWIAKSSMAGKDILQFALDVTIMFIFSPPKSWSKRKRNKAISGYMHHTVKPDLDNLIKNLDALNEIVFNDDNQIVKITAKKMYGEIPMAIFEIEEIDQK